jgi:cobalt/nickel transport system permease protein
VASIEHAFLDVGRLDRLARQDTPIHRLDPRVKVVTAAVFLACVVSFDKYEVAALLPYAVFPVTLAGLGRVPLGYLGKRVLLVAPFAVLVGIFNPLLDREVVMRLGSIGISGGVLSFASILIRFALTIGTTIVLIAVTSFDGLCLGLQRLGVPRVFTLQLLILYRYIFVLADEGMRLVRARALRSFGRRGLGMRVYGSLLGHMLLRTLDRARRIHAAMRCRGFTGEIRSARRLAMGRADLTFAVGWCVAFLILRAVSVPGLVGVLITRVAG